MFFFFFFFFFFFAVVLLDECYLLFGHNNHYQYKVSHLKIEKLE